MEYSFRIEPQNFQAFEDEQALIDKCKEWGLLSDKAAKSKTFFYKGHGLHEAVSLVGFVDKATAVIAFANEQTHCIHPSYLKEMQAASYESKAAPGRMPAEDPAPVEPVQPVEAAPEATAKPKKEKEKKPPKLVPPEGKVPMTATVKEFTTVPNHFSDNDDEVIIYEAVAIIDPDMPVGEAWSSNSATIKKLGLEVGDVITFDGKLVVKKLTKHPVAYKINNPSKINKQPS